MTRKSKSQISDRVSFKTSALHIFVLSALAISAPLYEVLIKNDQFLLEYNSSPAEMALFILLFSILIPAIMVGVLWLAKKVGERIYRSIFFSILGFLAALFFLQYLNTFAGLGGWATVFTSLVLVVTFLGIYLKFKHLRFFLSFLVLLPIASPVLFILSPEVSQIVFPKAVPLTMKDKKSDLPSVIFLVFDEFPVVSLLDAEGKVDALRFPNFSRLANESHWFSNTVTLACNTEAAVPAILTGNRPARKNRAPIVENYADNIFTLIANNYDYVNVHEKATHLCPNKICNAYSWLSSISAWGKFKLFNLDVALIYLWRVIPEDFSGFLPPVDGKWAGLMIKWAGIEALSLLEKYRMNNFIASLTNEFGNSFNFLHVLLPHRIWNILPSGKTYNANVSQQRAKADKKTGRKQWRLAAPVLESLQQQHLLQLRYVDQQLGKLVARLKSIGVYDNSVLVVTADHGISITMGNEIRRFSENNLGETLFVPLFIKLPHQARANTHPEPVETIDILPTIAKALGVRLDVETDGRGLLPMVQSSRTSVQTNCMGSLQTYELAGVLEQKEEVLKKRVSTFDLEDPSRSLYRFGPYRALIGKPLKDLDFPEESLAVKLSNKKSYAKVDLNKPQVPAYIEGTIVSQIPESAVYVAIAVNGIVQATAKIFVSDEQKRFAAMVPENSFINGRNRVQIFLVDREKVPDTFNPRYVSGPFCPHHSG